MGLQDVQTETPAEELRRFMKALLTDIRALEMMLERGMIETGVRRIGAEQEMFLVDEAWRPASVATEVLAAVNDDHFTHELALFNLEANADPVEFKGTCLSRMEAQLTELVQKAREAAATCGAQVVLSGILPTLTKSDLGMDNMTPKPRYYALNEGLTRLRGGEYDFNIKGVDELMVKHDSVMLESCNTSFQVHFQVAPEEFANLYNIAQLVAGPVIAAATNSPLLFGKRLWRETRIALFQQSVDTRSKSSHVRDQMSRVSFGDDWVNDSVLEIFKEDIARFRAFLSTELDTDPLALVEKGEPPQLSALRLHNGTIYRWNRACYGVANGQAHLRIENRVLPSGPTVIDEVANAALWFGAVAGIAQEEIDVRRLIDFEEVKGNFFAAARLGLGAQFDWLKGKTYPAEVFVADVLAPLAREGLIAAGVDADDVEKYISVVERRVKSGQTGSRWALRSLAGMTKSASRAEQLSALTAATAARQIEGKPVHEWPLADVIEAGNWRENYMRVDQYMTTDLFTVNQDELIDLVAAVMDWRHIRHVPVEDDDHRLVGIVSHRSLLRLLAKGEFNAPNAPIPVSTVMQATPITVAPEASTLEAISLMRRKRVGCLPVVKDGRLVGIVTERDFVEIAGQLLERQLAPPQRPEANDNNE